ncbi:MAG: phosphoribosyltransferase family protein, partial [Ruminococcus sp.]|nr:phosphoribosyltransferase family protein [Ruminococcus sp.]
MHTTREKYPDNLLAADFSEEHSHAVGQRLYCKEGKEIFKGMENVVFVDDEFTTGKTIVNFVNAIAEDTIGCRFYAASLINGMNIENLRRFKKMGITPLWLVKTEDSGEDMEKDMEVVPEKDIPKRSSSVEFIYADYPIDPRLGCNIGEYMDMCGDIAESTADKIMEMCIGRETADIADLGEIAVAGTEECMQPSIILGKELEERGGNVRCRSTTRSPIVPCRKEGYPLYGRSVLES